MGRRVASVDLIRMLVVVMVIGSWTVLRSIEAVESEVYYDNEVHTCKSNEYFDVDYLKCKKCETELNLVPSKDSKFFSS